LPCTAMRSKVPTLVSRAITFRSTWLVSWMVPRLFVSDLSKTARPPPRSVWGMAIDPVAAENFIWSAARLVDRHRYGMLFADGPAEAVVEALRAYRNPDGGFGHALEPDLRCPGSQPVPTLY